MWRIYRVEGASAERRKAVAVKFYPLVPTGWPAVVVNLNKISVESSYLPMSPVALVRKPASDAYTKVRRAMGDACKHDVGRAAPFFSVLSFELAASTFNNTTSEH